VCQFSGGQTPLGYDPKSQYNYNDLIARRNYSSYFPLIELIQKDYPDLKIVNYSLPNENVFINNGVTLTENYIFYIELLKYSKGFIGIDSSLAHFASASNRQGIVIWKGTKPSMLGWELHVNITGNIEPESIYQHFTELVKR
jgi:hypothetical protein